MRRCLALQLQPFLGAVYCTVVLHSVHDREWHYRIGSKSSLLTWKRQLRSGDFPSLGFDPLDRLLSLVVHDSLLLEVLDLQPVSDVHAHIHHSTTRTLVWVVARLRNAAAIPNSVHPTQAQRLCGASAPLPSRSHLPSCVRNFSRTLDPIVNRRSVPSPCRSWCLCCQERCSCRGIRKRRLVLRSIVSGSIVMATRMRLLVSSQALPHP